MSDEIISGFNCDDSQIPFAIDFNLAKPLAWKGSTCDTFECRIQYRHLFVKRLKSEYRDNPLYRAAFEKEYELGVTLEHSSLPRYIGFGGDYIAMDFIEGETLANLMRRNDRRLKNNRFAGRLLKELIDVTEYLHYRRVVHCDIKPDNIIISPYPDRPLTLIDLDKAYTPWLQTTHGDTQKYGCDDCEDGNIDFKGIGLIAKQLGIERVARISSKTNVSADSLKTALNADLNHGNNFKKLWWLAAAIAVTASAVAIFLNSTRENMVAGHEIISADTIIPETSDTSVITETDKTFIEVQTPQPASPNRGEIDKAWIAALIAEKSNLMADYRQELFSILNNDTIEIRSKHDAIYNYTHSSGQAMSAIISSAVNRYSGIPEPDVQNMVRKHPDWIRLIEECMATDADINEWKIKVSRH